MVTLAPIESDNDGDNVGMDAVHPAIAGVITSDMVPPSMRKKVPQPKPRYVGTLEMWVISQAAKECETSYASARRCLELAMEQRSQTKPFHAQLRSNREFVDDDFAAGFLAMVVDTVKYESGSFD